MSTKYVATIKFESECPLDEAALEYVRQALEVAGSHISRPRWCGHVVVKESGWERIKKEDD